MAAGDLTTLANVKAYLGQTAAAADGILGQLITAASAWVKDYLQREILQATHTNERHNGTGTASLMVRQWPITAVQALTVDGVAVDLAKVVVDGPLLVLTGGLRFTKGLRNVAVTYQAGYTEPPAAIAQACTELVAWRYKERERIGEASKSAGGQETVSYQTTDTPANVKTLLNQWRRVVPV